MGGQQVSGDRLLIIDSHHHLLDKLDPKKYAHLGNPRFLIDEYLNYLGTRHEVVASVAVEVRSMLRADGPEELRGVGEVEFLNGQAAMAASGAYGRCRVAAGIVAVGKLELGDRVKGVLEAYVAAAPNRLKGVRQEGCWDPDPTLLRGIFNCGPNVYLDRNFQEGFKHLEPLGLSFDAFVLAPQLGDVVALAQRFPGTQIILNHVGNPVGTGPYQGRLPELFPQWRQHMQSLAECENVSVKLGGMGTFLFGSPSNNADPPASAETLAAEWKPYFLTSIELFGARRCMFESNAPTDKAGTFDTIVSVFNILTAGASRVEKRDIFAGTAKRVYRLELPAS